MTAEPPTPSASVVLLRDGGQSLEVLLIKRHTESNVLGGVHTFPGGKLDDQDSSWVQRLDRSPERLHDALGEPELTADEAGALFVAAIRELFEEVRVLFATPVAHRQGGLADLLQTGVSLTASALNPWSRWVTPVGSLMSRKRFDARFFVARAPSNQKPLHDAYEVTELFWMEPRFALEEFIARDILLTPPQLMSLVHLSRHRSVASVLAEARASKPPCVQPEIIDDGTMRLLLLPGDDHHSIRRRALPGPTRLIWRKDRFEPELGLAGLLR